MIQLEQVRTLEQKVKQAVELISRLKSENEYLNSRLTTYEVRIQELENLINSFRNSQTEIEEGIINALEELDNIENSGSSPSPQGEQVPSAPMEDQKTVEVSVSSFPAEEDFREEPQETPVYQDQSEGTEQDLFSGTFEEPKEEEPTLGIF